MELFAVIVLVCIILTLTNINNSLWREIYESTGHFKKNEPGIFLCCLVTIVSIAIISSCVYYIIDWGQPLLK